MLSLHIDLGAILTNIRNNIHCIIQVDWIKCLDLLNALINSKFNSLLPSNLDPLTAFCSGGGELSGGGGKEAQTAFCSGGEWVGVGTKKQSQACGCGAVTFGKVFFWEFEHESLL